LADNKTEGALTAAAEYRLDLILNEWAEHVSKSLGNEGDAIVDDIFIITKDLGYQWWKQLFERRSFNNANVYPSWTVNTEVV
jgi:hypothetical protein